MGHSILTFADRHLLLPDDHVRELLEAFDNDLRETPVASLNFLSEFFASELCGVPGCADPQLADHLATQTSVEEFLALIRRVQERAERLEGPASSRLGANLVKVFELVEEK